jgi:hypothetical protein
MLPEGTVSTEEKMTIDERRKYLRKMRARYVKARRREQSRLLDEMQAVTGLHRKSLIRLMGGTLERKPRTRQRGRTYDTEVAYVVRIVAESLDHICAERLTPSLAWMAEHLAAHGELQVSLSVIEKLEGISVSTTRRILGRVEQEPAPWKRRAVGRGPHLTRDIPMKRLPWQEQRPGYLEGDTVHHCGPSASGEYICTVQMIDIATGWSERVAILGRSYLVMEDAFLRIGLPPK